ASFLDKPYAPSPYTPVSRLFWNEIYLDPEHSMPLGTTCEVDTESAAKARRLTSFDEVPYRTVMGLKRRVLEEQTRICLSQPGPAEQFERYIADKPEVADYAAFRAAVERLGPSWRDWPEEPRLGRLSPGDFDIDTSNYYAFAQWRLDAQMTGLSRRSYAADVRLYLDLPVGVHSDGYDAWRYRDLFVPGVSVGAPPDLLALDGQNWGFEPLNPVQQRASGYEYMRAYLAHHLSVASMLRVDHAIGLHRMFWIPRGASGRDGVFMRQHAEELYAILSLESHRHQAVLVGENLGLVPPEVDEGLREHGIAGMYVQRYSLTGDSSQPVESPPEDAVVCFGTHDTPPFAAFWTDEDLRERERIGLDGPIPRDTEIETRHGEKEALVEYLRRRGMLEARPTTAQVYRASTELLAESDAKWLLLNLEDTWGETRSQNVPGTLSEQHPNWSFRAAHSIEQFDDLRETTETVMAVRSLRPKGQKEQPRAIQEGGASS
ncbi:MAG TPA: 4-alpha-glucanotransferase, partial [Dehalococcoidia bacterium]|nr:4-alpha-glucanotransferase [Dehalococcoidia bacterium]